MNDTTLTDFATCVARARAIVACCRDEAPADFDPVNLGGGSTPPVNYQAAIEQVMSGLNATSRGTLRTAATYQPQYGALEEDNLNNLLFGNAGASYNVAPPGAPAGTAAPGASNFSSPGYAGLTVPGTPGSTPIGGNKAGSAMMIPAMMSGNGGAAPGAAAGGPGTGNVSSIPGAPGYVNMIGQLNALAPTINPAGASMLAQLQNTTSADLANGYNPGAGLARNVSQGILSSNVGTLGGTGDVSAYNQALGMSAFGQQLYQQRLANAGSALTANQNFYQGIDQPAFNTTLAMSGAAGPGFFNPNPFAQNVAASQFNANAAQGIAGQNSNAALVGAGISAAASLAGAFA